MQSFTSVPACEPWMMITVVSAAVQPFALASGITTFAVSRPISLLTRLNQMPPGMGMLMAM